MPLTLDHNRAKFAYDSVKRYFSNSGNNKDEFKSWAQKLPALIVNCGLLQGMTFYKEDQTKGKPIYNIIQNYLSANTFLLNNIDFVDYLLGHVQDVNQLQRLTHEVVLFSTWLKRFSSILLNP